MSKLLIVLTALSLLSCSTASFKEMPVKDIVAKSKKNIHKWASTEFEVKSTGVGVHSQDRGIWFLNSELSYRSSKSLNVRLSTEVVKKFKDQYHIDSVAGLEGKKIKVVGTATPKRFCVRKGCPIGAGLNKPAMYIQTQMLIEDIRNIELL